MGARRYGPTDLEDIASAWDAAVDATPDVDPFCASTTWSFSAAASFDDVGPPEIVGDGIAFCGLRPARSAQGPILVGLDPIWGFATPFVGPPLHAADMLVRRLESDDEWTLAVVAGQREDSVLTACLARAIGDRWTLYRGSGEARLRIDLGDGFDTWFGRRSARFRQRMRRLDRDATATGVTIEDVSAAPSDDVMDRVLAVEATSWKAEEDTGLASADLAAFYRQVFARLAARDHLRVLLARLDGTDVGYIAGGIRGDTYRGLQLGYARSAADLGLGHVLQLAQLRRLEREGVSVYDLGMDMAYKRRWADRADETISVIVARQPVAGS